MSYLLLALRNLTRNRRRTALSIAVVASGTAALVLTAGFVRFSFDGLREAMIHGGLGHLEVARADAVEKRGPASLDRPAGEGIDDWRKLRDEIEKVPHVVAVGANLHVMGLAQTAAGGSVSFVGVGVEPARERAMGFTTKLRAGRLLADGAPAPGKDTVLLTPGLAESLGVQPGARVTLVTSDADGMLNALDVRVAGIYTTGVAELDGRMLKLPLASATRLAQTARVSDLLVTLDETARTAEVGARLRELLAGREPRLAVTPWTKRAPFYGQVRALYRAIFLFLGAIVLVLVVLAASNTLVMTVFERLRELGTLRAIGTTPAQIAALLLGEAAWLGALGGLVGCVLGAVAIAAINAAGLHMPPPPGAVDPIDLRLAFVPVAFGAATALMIVVLVVASLAPILRATRIAIVDALGHV